MSWRLDQDESNFSSAQKIAWHWVLPYKHLPIVNSEYKRVREFTKLLEQAFSPQALAAAVKRLRL